MRSSDIHLRASSQEIPQPSITEIICKINYLKFHSNFPGANELTTTVPVPLSRPSPYILTSVVGTQSAYPSLAAVTGPSPGCHGAAEAPPSPDGCATSPLASWPSPTAPGGRPPSAQQSHVTSLPVNAENIMLSGGCCRGVKLPWIFQGAPLQWWVSARKT